jgi:glutaredoxin 3
MPPITIYTLESCPYCEAAKRLLKQKAAAFEEIGVDGRPDVRAELRATTGGRSTLPQIWIGARHVGGCDDLYALETSGELDRLLFADTEAS